MNGTRPLDADGQPVVSGQFSQSIRVAGHADGAAVEMLTTFIDGRHDAVSIVAILQGANGADIPADAITLSPYNG